MLANLASCSLAALAAIEQGAVPKRSAVLARAWDAIAAQNDHEPAASELVGKEGDARAQPPE